MKLQLFHHRSSRLHRNSLRPSRHMKKQQLDACAYRPKPGKTVSKLATRSDIVGHKRSTIYHLTNSYLPAILVLVSATRSMDQQSLLNERTDLFE